MNPENQQNSELILSVLNQHYKDLSKNKIKILDICCGVYDPKGIDYDPSGEIYQPLVAQVLAQNDFSVTGIDKRENVTTEGDEIDFIHRQDINILDENWSENLEKDWNALIFLRSWDTPEIFLHYQKLLKINDVNLLSLEIAKIYLPYFTDLLGTNGLFITSEICNFGLCDDEFEVQLYKNQVSQLMKINGLEYINQEDGVSWYVKISSKK